LERIKKGWVRVRAIDRYKWLNPKQAKTCQLLAELFKRKYERRRIKARKLGYITKRDIWACLIEAGYKPTYENIKRRYRLMFRSQPLKDWIFIYLWDLGVDLEM
jgi:hypothetical protein